jgi:hypothetical protein
MTSARAVVIARIAQAPRWGAYLDLVERHNHGDGWAALYFLY